MNKKKKAKNVNAKKVRMNRKSASAVGVFRKDQVLSVGYDLTVEQADRFVRIGIASPYETATIAKASDGRSGDPVEKVFAALVKSGRITKTGSGWYKIDNVSKRKNEILRDIEQGIVKS